MSTGAAREQEMATLRRRAAELTQAIEAHWQTEQRVLEAEQRRRRLLDVTKDIIVFSVKGVIVEVNQQFKTLLGYEDHEVVGRRAIDLTAPQHRDLAAGHIDSESTALYEGACVRKDGSWITIEVCGRAILYLGRPARIAVMRDITERKRAEAATRAALVQREVIRAQEAILAQLSTPLLPITDEILVLPLIGAVNAERAAQVIRALVEGVARNRARTAILDITGVPDVDHHVADALLHTAGAVRLLGARVILTGIRPEVAERLVNLGIDLTGVMTCATLERGVAHALGGAGKRTRR